MTKLGKLAGTALGLTILATLPAVADGLIGPDGQATFHAVGLRAPISTPALYAAAFVPHQVAQQEARKSRPVPDPISSGEMVSAWTSAVFLGTPTATRTAVDQWVAVAYFLGPRRR